MLIILPGEIQETAYSNLEACIPHGKCLPVFALGYYIVGTLCLRIAASLLK